MKLTLVPHIKRLPVSVLIATIVILLGCAAPAPAPAPPPAPAPAPPPTPPTAPVPPPSIKIISPEGGATVAEGSVDISVEVMDFNIVTPTSEKVPGEGHIHYYLDVDIPTAPGEPAVTAPNTYKATTETMVTWDKVGPGMHTFGVQLVNNDHTPLEPPAILQVTVNVETAIIVPGADGTALYAYITEVNHYKNWDMWPGKGEMYRSRSAVHGSFLTTYVSEDVYSALQNDEAMMPVNGIIVKENYSPEKDLAATTVMYKVQGYNAEHHDWFWAKYRPDGTIDAEGKVEGCISCHGLRKDNDYIWTNTPPIIQISSPEDGSTVPAGDIEVAVSVFNFNVVSKLS